MLLFRHYLYRLPRTEGYGSEREIQLAIRRFRDFRTRQTPKKKSGAERVELLKEAGLRVVAVSFPLSFELFA